MGVETKLIKILINQLISNTSSRLIMNSNIGEYLKSLSAGRMSSICREGRALFMGYREKRLLTIMQELPALREGTMVLEPKSIQEERARQSIWSNRTSSSCF